MASPTPRRVAALRGTCRGLCGAPLIARRDDRRNPTYACAAGPGRAGCGRIRRNAVDVETEVVGRLWEVIESGALSEPVAPPDLTPAMLKA